MAAIGDIYKIRVLCTNGTQTGINVLHYVASSWNGTGPTDAQVATAFDTLFAAVYKALLANVATYRGIGAQFIWPGPMRVEAFTIASLGVGTAGATGMAPMVSGLLGLRTGLAGPKNRGRVYVPFPSTTDDSAAGEPTAGYQTKLGNLATPLLNGTVAGAGGNTAGFLPCIYHRALHTYDIVTSAVITTHWRTQRRRSFAAKGDVAPF